MNDVIYDEEQVVDHVTTRHHYSSSQTVIGIVVGGILLVALSAFYYYHWMRCRRIKETIARYLGRSNSDTSDLSPSTHLINSTPIKLDPMRQRARRQLGDYSEILDVDYLSMDENHGKFDDGCKAEPQTLPFVRKIPYMPPIRESLSVDDLSVYRSGDNSFRTMLDRSLKSPLAIHLDDKEETPRSLEEEEGAPPHSMMMICSEKTQNVRHSLDQSEEGEDFREIELPEYNSIYASTDDLLDDTADHSIKLD